MKKKPLKIFLLIIISLFLTKNVFSAPICKAEKTTLTEEDILLKNNETNEVEEETENKDQIENRTEIKKEEESDIEISADKTIELDKEKGVMIATGNAFVKEGITKLSADMLTAFSCQTKDGETQILQINADGNVIINSDQGNASAKRGTYFVEEKIIELYDNVKLEKDGDILVGDKGEFNVYTGKGEISVVPTSEGSKRKVYGIIKSKKK